MSARTHLVGLLCLLVLTAGQAFAYPDELGFPLRIGLFQIGVPREVILEPGDGNIEIFDLYHRQSLYSGPCTRLLARIHGDELHLELAVGVKIISGQRLAFTPIGKGPHFTRVGTTAKNLRAYRGSIELVPFGGRMLIVNLIGTEEYLRSVVPCEIGKDAPDAALEAQAVAARTYLVRNLKRHAPGGFYLCDGQHCQAYGGMRYESSRASIAVANTRGLVLTYDGVIANSVYHANCGGELRSCDAVWGGPVVPYLPSHPDRFGNHSPFCRLPQQTKKKTPLPQRPEGSQYEPYGDRETDNAGWNSLLLWSEARQATSRARGHGVGMCQDGAIGMALLGYSRNQILGFYYPGTKLARLSSSLLPPGETVPIEQQITGGDRQAFLLKQPPITPPRIPSGSSTGKVEARPAADKTAVSRKTAARDVTTTMPSGLSRWFWSNRPPVPHTSKARAGTLKPSTKKKNEKKEKKAKKDESASKKDQKPQKKKSTSDKTEKDSTKRKDDGKSEPVGKKKKTGTTTEKNASARKVEKKSGSGGEKNGSESEKKSGSGKKKKVSREVKEDES